MAALSWSPTPPCFACRWTVRGVTPDGRWATTIFDLREDRRHVAVYLATLAEFAVLIDMAAVRVLADTLTNGEACAVPALHPVHDSRLLGLRPTNTPDQPLWTSRPAVPTEPMELYLCLPRAPEMRIGYAGERLSDLHAVVAQIAESTRSPTASTPSRHDGPVR